MKRLFFHIQFVAFAIAKCYEPTVAHPPPEYDPKDTLLQRAFARINTALVASISAPEYASTSFSVEITSSKASLWSRHHTARERNSSRPDIPEVNGDALYRIASITKAFTVLGMLYQHEAGNISLDNSIDQYIEELRGEQNGSIPWNDITLRSLASQLSGIPREFAQSDFINANFGPLPADYGLPPLPHDGMLNCDEYSNNYSTPCDAQDLINDLKTKHPIFAPNQMSTYSNIAFEFLGLVLQNATAQKYEEYIEDAIFKRLDMSKSTFSTPPDSAGVIPIGFNYWGIDAGVQNPTGGIYSSTADLSKFLRYVLKHYNDITPAANWLHPASPTRGLHSFYGMPWEIFHTDSVLEKSKRTVRFVTKGGGLPGYSSMIITVPEYDLGITILVAGNPGVFRHMIETVTTEIVRAAEAIAIRQLGERYVGTYVPSTPGLNSSIILAADRRGLVVEEFISNSTDVIAALFPILTGAKKGSTGYAQLVPTLLDVDEASHKGEKWRLLLSIERSDIQDVWDDFCILDIDFPSYARRPINEVVFWDGEGGGFQRLELPAYRVILTRNDGSGVEHGNQEMLEL